MLLRNTCLISFTDCHLQLDLSAVNVTELHTYEHLEIAAVDDSKYHSSTWYRLISHCMIITRLHVQSLFTCVSHLAISLQLLEFQFRCLSTPRSCQHLQHLFFFRDFLRPIINYYYVQVNVIFTLIPARIFYLLLCA